MKLAFFILAACLCACAPKTAPEQDPPPRPAACDSLYAILPANFIIDLAAGANVILDPAYQEFALFCSPDEAGEVLRHFEDEKRLPKDSEWRVYRLEGSFEELVQACNDGQYCLGAKARVVDWIAPE